MAKAVVEQNLLLGYERNWQRNVDVMGVQVVSVYCMYMMMIKLGRPYIYRIT
jgi:hypothetical protein